MLTYTKKEAEIVAAALRENVCVLRRLGEIATAPGLKAKLLEKEQAAQALADRAVAALSRPGSQS